MSDSTWHGEAQPAVTGAAYASAAINNSSQRKSEKERLITRLPQRENKFGEGL